MVKPVEGCCLAAVFLLYRCGLLNGWWLVAGLAGTWYGVELPGVILPGKEVVDTPFQAR